MTSNVVMIQSYIMQREEQEQIRECEILYNALQSIIDHTEYELQNFVGNKDSFDFIRVFEKGHVKNIRVSKYNNKISFEYELDA